jgi:penicillin amidase
MTRLRWNVTDIETGETYRTYLAGASLLGSPVMTHGRSPIVAWGLTAINPDVSDLFIEYFRGDHYLTSEKTWAAFETRTETIKVRFGSD